MAHEPADSGHVPVHLALSVSGGTLEGDIAVPTAPVPPSKLLPLARALSGHIVELTVLQASREGRHVSCRAGCGACCRQLVPVSETEARTIAALVDSLPEPRRTAVRARFADARRRLDDAGLLAPLLDERRPFWSKPERADFGLNYFRQGIPCPFLEDESCSIHPERPITCREYLVTSDPKHCAEPGSKQIEGIRLPTHVWAALAEQSDTPSPPEMPAWVPLVLAPEWAGSHPDEPAPRPGPELFTAFLDAIASMVKHRSRGEVTPDPSIRGQVPSSGLAQGRQDE